MEQLRQDLRDVLRTIRATPGFTLVVTLTLALGIGGTAAIFSVMNVAVLRPLPYKASESLVHLGDVQGDQRDLPASFPEFVDWRDRTTALFSGIGAVLGQGEVLSGAHGDAEQLQGTMTSANVPAMLGVHPLVGRTFRPDEEGPNATRVVMVSERIWRDHFNADPSIIGRTITLTGQPVVVIGVYPLTAATVIPTRYWYGRGIPIDFWETLNLSEAKSPRGQHMIDVIARLRPGVTAEAAARRLTGIAKTIGDERATTHRIELIPLATELVGDMRVPLQTLLVAGALLLLIACANVANLLLARGAGRQREFAVRSALGAPRGRLIRHVALEGIIRALIGGAVGTLLAYVTTMFLRTWLGGTVPRAAELSIDLPVLGLVVVLSLISGVLFSVVPATRAARVDLASGLRDGTRGMAGSATSDRWRRSLIVAQLALAFVVVTTGMLLTRSFARLISQPKGFDPNGLVAVRTWLPGIRYPDSLAKGAFHQRVQQQLEAAYGSGNVTSASGLPVEGGTSGSIGVDGRQSDPNNVVMVEKRIVGNEYFKVLGSRVVAGRDFAGGDVLGAVPVAVVNATFAARVFPNESAVGKRITFGWGTNATQTIVGVVADLREGPLDAGPKPAVYVSAAQDPSSSENFIIRTTHSEAEVRRVYAAALRAIDPALPVVEVRRVSDVVAGSVRQRRLSATILSAFAGGALLLAAVGLFGVISYSVAQRTRELGVRAALGARRSDLMMLVLRQAISLTATGVTFGVLGTVVSGRAVASQLFGVTTLDPSTLLLTAAILGAVALLAAALPAVRAMGIDPLKALRSD